MNLHDANIQMRQVMVDAKMVFANQLVQALSAVNSDSLVDYGIPELANISGSQGIKIAQYNDNPDLNLYLMFYDGWYSLTTGRYNIKGYWCREVDTGRSAAYNPPKKGARYEVASYDNYKRGREYTFRCNSLQDTPTYIDLADQVSKMFKSLLRSYKIGKKREAKSLEQIQQQVTKYNTISHGTDTNTTKS